MVKSPDPPGPVVKPSPGNFSPHLLSVLLTLVVLAVIQLLFWAVSEIPPVVPPLLVAVIYSSVTGGVRGGLTSSAIVVAYTSYLYFFTGDQFFRHSQGSIQSVVMLGITSVTISVSVGFLRRAIDRASQETQRRREELEASQNELVAARKLLEELQVGDNVLLQTLMDQMPDNIYFKDQKSRFLKINRSLAHLFGLEDPEQAVGKTDFDFFTAEHAMPAYEDEQQIVATGQPIVGSVEKETFANGAQRWIITTKMPLRNNAGHIVGTFGLSRDITDMKRAEEERERLHRLEALYEAKSLMLANVSHEVGTPLHVIQNFAQMIKDGKYGQVSETIHQPLDRILSNTQHVVRVVETMLDLSKAEKGALDAQIEEFDPLNLVRERVYSFQESRWRPGIELATVFPDHCRKIHSDATKLCQIIDNLLANAVKFTERGQITVGFREQEEPSPGFVIIWVQDTGIGIAAEHLEHVKTAFYQAHTGDSRPYEGAGLGLSIVETSLRLLGGAIRIVSQLRVGTLVAVALPTTLENWNREELCKKAQECLNSTKEVTQWNKQSG